jgi:hypothetical protein
MPIIIESAGSHVFDLGHIRRQRGEELLRLLLDMAGLPLNLLWRLQVQKKLNCNAETPPVRVVDEPRKWTVHLKIKPGDNNSCHYCSLLMPGGLNGETVYFLLGKVSVELDRNWRHRIVESSNGMQSKRPEDLFSNDPIPAEAELTAAAEPAKAELPLAPPPDPQPPFVPPAPENIPQAESCEPANIPSGRARGWLNDNDKIRLLLLAIHEINESGAFPQDQWSDLLSERMDWKGVNRHEVGGVLTVLVRKNFIERRIRNSKPYGYLLSEEGLRFIADLIAPTSTPPSFPPSPPPLAPPVVPPAPRLAASSATASFVSRAANEPSEIIRSFGPIAKQFLDANTRLEQITRREEELIAEQNALKQEREQIYRLLEDNQVQSVLANLARLVKAKD